MRVRINSELTTIEQNENIKIIFACESGSRAWGFPSKDSDYDVRFIYVRQLDWYLSIFNKRDVIEKPINEGLDINGWDVSKALVLMRKSNPPLFEWLKSPIIYYEDSSIMVKLRNIANITFSSMSCLHHYLSMAKGNFREYLQSDFVRAKKYFYVLRPVLACRWIESYGTMPPTEFEKLITLVDDRHLLFLIEELLKRKMAGDELDSEPKIYELNHFLETEISRIESTMAKANKPEAFAETVFNEIFKDILQEVWKTKTF